MNAEALQSKFIADLERCNEKQRLVIESTEGPMNVISGPGTGKTTMVTLRIARMLTVQDVKPENILCFSFTNAACTELRERLEKRIGGIAAYKVGVYTFHAFANEVIMQHIDYLGISNLRTISDLEKIEITKKFIDGLHTDNPLRRLKGDEYFEVKRLTWLNQVMREEGMTVEELVAKIDDFVESLPNNPDYQYKRKYTDKSGKVFLAGDPNPNKIEEVKKYMDFTKSAVLAMPKLQGSISGQGFYDYADMITWAIAILADNEGLRRFIQERYQYVIVDEFQDTSGSQLYLLTLLLEYWMPDANVLLVGDPDQMIMSFQGAHAHSQQEFLEQFGDHLQVITMEDNYRSTAAILEAAHSVIIQNESRLGVNALNAAAYNAKDGGLMPQVRAYNTPTQELADIARELWKMHSDCKDLSEVFCLFPKHNAYSDFILALDGMGIPYQVSRPIDVLAHRTARMVLSIFEYIAIECDRHRQGEGEHLIFEALHFPFIGVSHVDVSRITRHIWNHAKPRPSWFTVITDPNALEQAGCNDVNTICNAGHFFGEIMSQAFAKASVLEIYRTIMQGGGLMKWVMQQPDALLHLDVLNSLHRFIDEQTHRRPYLTCYELVQVIADMRSEHLRLNVQRNGGKTKGVKIMTFHAAKGMEADTVYLIGCRKDALDDTGSRGGTQYKLPPTVTRTAFDDGGEEERRKLFYVGITRARKNLYISYSTADNSGKDRSKSKFVSEMLAHGTAEEFSVEVEQYDIALYESAAISTVRASSDDGNALTDEELDDMLRGYKLSPTHLNVYLDCQSRFYLDYVLRMPKVKNMYAAFGSANDEALRELHRIGTVKHLATRERKEVEVEKKELLTEMLVSKYGDTYEQIVQMSAEDELKTFIETFEAAMKQQRGYFPSQTAFENRMAYGKDQLTTFYNHYRPHMPGVCQTGYSLNVFYHLYPLTGEMDNVVWVGKDEVVVEDWKTGNALKGIAKVKHCVDLSGGITKEMVEDATSIGDYKRQIYFYRIMINNHPTLTIKPVAGKVRFIESADTGGVPMAIDVPFNENEEQLVKQQIAYAYKGILGKQFNKGCNDPLCSACKFIQEAGIVLPGKIKDHE